MYRPRHRSTRARRRQLIIRLLVVCVVATVAVKVGESWPGRGEARADVAARSTSPVTTVGGTDEASSATAGTVRTTAASTSTTAATTSTTADAAGGSGILSTVAATEYLQSRSGDVTAAVYDLTTGAMSLWRPDVSDEDTASIVKVDILATLLHQAQDANRPLTPSEEDLATTMIEDSDDDSATSLWDEIGGNTAVSTFNQLVGLQDTQPGTDGYWGLTTTTAEDQVRLLQALVQPNSELTQASRYYELGLMEQIEPSEDWGVSSGPPAGVTVALKNGWLPTDAADDSWQINSIGWVDGDGRDYLISVLTMDDPTEDYGIDTIEGLASLVWTQLSTG